MGLVEAQSMKYRVVERIIADSKGEEVLYQDNLLEKK
jgi:hypothetical protein